MSERTAAFTIRKATARDIDQLDAVDAKVSGMRKPGYWQDLFDQYRTRRGAERFMYLAEATGEGGRGASAPGRVIGFVVGEVRAWEFGSEKCGWVFAISVDPTAREEGVGQALLKKIADSFRDIGVHTVRTMIARDNHLLMSFFRSEGMKAGPYLQLEMDLD